VLLVKRILKVIELCGEQANCYISAQARGQDRTKKRECTLLRSTNFKGTEAKETSYGGNKLGQYREDFTEKEERKQKGKITSLLDLRLIPTLQRSCVMLQPAQGPIVSSQKKV